MKVKVKKPFTHLEKPYKEGDEFEGDPGECEPLIYQGFAEAEKEKGAQGQSQGQEHQSHHQGQPKT